MFERLLSILMTGAVLGLVVGRNLTRNLIWLSVFSLLLTVKYFTLNAPDVAITEAALGTGLTTLVFLTAIRKTRAPVPTARGRTGAERGEPHDD